MTPAAAAPRCRADRRSVPLSVLTGSLVALFALDAALLLAFLGWPLPVVLIAAGVGPVLLGQLAARCIVGGTRVAPGTLVTCAAIALALLLLGGEGRLLYANADWQIRDVLLADLATHHWPFDYRLDGIAQMLRAPLGMYLVPAILGGANQAGRDGALLAHNLAMLTLVLAMGSALFDGARARVAAAMVFVAFSGLDVIGTLVAAAMSGHANWDHLERWLPGYQYSAHLTQIFWVPQHAMAGWAAAVCYALWRRGLASSGPFAATIPLLALWSPLAVMGAVPFAILAGMVTLRSGRWTRADVLLTAAALLLSVPALAYLGTDAHRLGATFNAPPIAAYLLLAGLEIAPLALPLLARDRDLGDRPTLVLAVACLLVMPLVKLGMNSDFQMRASIMPLALLALGIGGWIGRTPNIGARTIMLSVLALGSVTGAAEIARAVRWRPSPPPRCALPEAWLQQSGLVVPHDSYFAASRSFPAWLRPTAPSEIVVMPARPRRCWDRPWRVAR